MSELAECRHCGTLFHLSKGARRLFECNNCGKVVKTDHQHPKASVKKSAISDGERFKRFQDRLSRAIFLLGSTVGIFVLLMMIPTAIYIEHSMLSFIFILFELVFGTLLVCASVSFYLLSSQVTSLQALMTFHQHNLAIFHDQIARLFTMFKRRD